MQSPIFGNGRFASLGAGLRAAALTGHARNAVAAASIAAVGSVAYVRSWKDPPPKAPSDRWVPTQGGCRLTSSAQCMHACRVENATSLVHNQYSSTLPVHACLLQPGQAVGQLWALQRSKQSCAAASCMRAAPQLTSAQNPARVPLSAQHAL